MYFSIKKNNPNCKKHQQLWLKNYRMVQSVEVIAYSRCVKFETYFNFKSQKSTAPEISPSGSDLLAGGWVASKFHLMHMSLFCRVCKPPKVAALHAQKAATHFAGAHFMRILAAFVCVCVRWGWILFTTCSSERAGPGHKLVRVFLHCGCRGARRGVCATERRRETRERIKLCPEAETLQSYSAASWLEIR